MSAWSNYTLRILYNLFLLRNDTHAIGFHINKSDLMILSREYWMIYLGPGFLAVVWFGFSLTPSPLFRQLVSSPFSQSSWTSLLTGGRGRGWGRSQIIQQLESLVLYKSFNTLWYYPLTAADSAQALPLTYVRLFFSESVIVCGRDSPRPQSYLNSNERIRTGEFRCMMNRDYLTINM